MIDELDRSCTILNERLHCSTCRVYVRKDHERREPVLIVRYGLKYRFGNERQRTFRTNDQAAENLERRCAIEKRLHVITGRVLDTKLLAQPSYKLRISLNLALDLHQPRGERRLGGGELTLGIGLGAIDKGAGRQHEANRGQSLIGVLGGAAAHAAGIVGDDSTDGAGRSAGRIGTEPIAVTMQCEIGA